MGTRCKITVQETVAELKKYYRRSAAGLRPRIAMLLLIIGGIRATQQLAKRIKVNRNSISKWKHIYKEQGLEALLKDNRGGKRHGGLGEEQKQQLAKKLSQPKEAFTSFKAATFWINEQFGMHKGYHAVNKYIKRNFGASLKVGRKSHILKEAEAEVLFKKSSNYLPTH
jgi:transposase